MDSSGIHCKILHLDKTGIQLEFIPVQSESLADVECFSSRRTIPVELVGDMKDLLLAILKLALHFGWIRYSQMHCLVECITSMHQQIPILSFGIIALELSLFLAS